MKAQFPFMKLASSHHLGHMPEQYAQHFKKKLGSKKPKKYWSTQLKDFKDKNVKLSSTLWPQRATKAQKMVKHF